MRSFIFFSYGLVSAWSLICKLLTNDVNHTVYVWSEVFLTETSPSRKELALSLDSLVSNEILDNMIAISGKDSYEYTLRLFHKEKCLNAKQKGVVWNRILILTTIILFTQRVVLIHF